MILLDTKWQNRNFVNDLNVQRVLDQLFDSDILIVPEVPAMTEEEIKVFFSKIARFSLVLLHPRVCRRGW